MAKSTNSIAAYKTTGMTASGGGGGAVPERGGAPNPAHNVPAVIPFALITEQANTEVPIDYTSTTGIKLFNSAILKLPEIFDGEPKSINLFNKKLTERAKQSGWMETGANIIMIADSTGTLRNLITEYGRLTVDDIEANTKNFIGQQTRQAHNSIQLFHCQTNSMTEAAHLKIVAESDKYM